MSEITIETPQQALGESTIFKRDLLMRSLKYAKRPILFKLMNLKLIPLAAFAGMRVDSVDEDSCVVSIPGGWRTRNPFGSTYWAAQGMAAEMASGLLPFMYTQASPKKVNMILASCEAKFTRQCRGRATFSCESGPATRHAIEATIQTGERQLCEHKVIGRDPNGEVISEWDFVWSLKVSSR